LWYNNIEWEAKEMKTTIKLFIFEPYDWAYCGGAVGIVAENFEQAVELAIEEFTDDEGVCDDKFQKTTEGFEKDHWSQWLLSDELTIIEDGPPNPRVLFCNWNYS
jgi:hypothetical protein